MSTEQKRRAISRAYPGLKWESKVKAMPEKQVHATYMRLMDAGKLQESK